MPPATATASTAAIAAPSARCREAGTGMAQCLARISARSAAMAAGAAKGKATAGGAAPATPHGLQPRAPGASGR
eukprot:8481961-Alexandrium_andersonii.AAC.1